MLERQEPAPSGGRSELSLLRALFPDIVAEVDAAYLGNGGADARAEAELDARLDAAGEELLAGTGLAGITDPEPRALFEAAFDAARSLARALGVDAPEPEEFELAGVELGALARRAEAGSAELVPVVAPYGAGAAAWREAYAELASEHPAVLADPAAAAGEPLILAGEIQREFAWLDLPPQGVTQTQPRGGRVSWTIRLIPASPAAPQRGLSHAHGPHASLPEMLALQVARIRAGEAPVDGSSFTWLDGELGDGKLAGRHVYDAGERAVRISAREVGSQGPHLGARPPVA
ncbi:hypothetical protein [Leucobacter luti]|uniref:hypothetical protein n=1 Tax=Leucobacter luti TaxID=340320 RepID=UPI003CFDF6B3